jgi:pyruvate kinase
MVTLPTEAADNPLLVAEMLAAGMNLARINCAHDDPTTWNRMVENIRRAADDAGTECRIVMDLSGPKLRTGELKPGPRVIHIRPKRDPLGNVIAPRRIRLIPDDVLQHGTKAAVIPVSRECIEQAREGDRIRFRDTRGKKRRLVISTKDDKGLVLETFQGAYIASGTKLTLIPADDGKKRAYEVGELPAVELPLLLHVGDTLIIHRDAIPGEPAIEDADGVVLEPAHIACQQPEVFEYLSPGEAISLNDGKISGVIQNVSTEQLEVEITKAKPTGSRLRGQRGINFPNSDIRLPGLTKADEENLAFVAEHADAVSLSFIRKPKDVEALLAALDELSAAHLGLIIKVETRKGFKSLPKVMLAAMRRYPVAVMIARGDLAVEGTSGRNFMGLRSCTNAGHVGHPGARTGSKEGAPLARRNNRRGAIATCGLRHAQQGTTYPRGNSHTRQHPARHAVALLQEDILTGGGCTWLELTDV